MIIIGKVLFILLLVIAVVVGGLFILKNMRENEDVVETPVPSEEVVKEVEKSTVPSDDVKEQPNTENTEPKEKEFKEAPDFSLKDLSGEEVSLSDYRGKIVLVNFWATWCGYCNVEMPDFQKVQDENEDVVVLAVNVMEEESIVNDYIKEGGYNFQVVLDKEGTVAKTYLINAFPTTYVVDEEGMLLGGVRGMVTYDQLNQILADVRNN